MGVRNRLEGLSPIHTDTDRRPPLDTIFEVLRNDRRRLLLHYLKHREEAVPVREAVEQIAAWENDKAPEHVTVEERQRVHVSMLQSHLPTMESAGLVTYDQEENVIELTDRALGLDIYLEVVPEGDIDWGEYYTGVTLFNIVMLGFVWLDLYPFAMIPTVAWVVFVPVVFTIAALLHRWYQRTHQLGSGPPQIS